MEKNCDCWTDARGYWRLGVRCEARERELWQLALRRFVTSGDSARWREDRMRIHKRIREKDDA